MSTPTNPAPPPSRLRWSGWDHALFEGLLALIAIGSVVVGVLYGLDTATADHLERPVDLDENVATVNLAAVDGYRLNIESATLVIEEPGVGRRIVTMLPMALTATVVGIAATLLWQIAHSIRAGDPFHRSNARRLTWAAVVVLLGGMAASMADAVVSMSFAHAAQDLPVSGSGTLSLLPVPIGIVLAALSEIFRRGAALRDEVEGLV